MLHKHYCENDVEALIALLDDAVHWFGAGEYEYAVGIETVAPIFRRFAGQVPKCNISDEEYDVVQDRTGNVSLYWPNMGCYRCFHPDQPTGSSTGYDGVPVEGRAAALLPHSHFQSLSGDDERGSWVSC